MSSQELIHSINNQLTVILGRADILSRARVDEETQSACLEIRAAAKKLDRLVRQYVDCSVSDRAS